MKAELNKHGALVVTPDTQTEAYAMAQWLRVNVISIQIMQLDEERFVRGSALSVGLKCRQEGKA